MKAQYCKQRHGFDIVLTPIKRHLLRDDFLKDVHNILVEPAGTSSEDPVLLGAVDTAHNLPKWFPFKVQYHFPGGEYVVGKLWLIANNHRTIFIVDGHAHDLATIFTAYSRLVEVGKAGRQIPPEPCAQSVITSPQP